MERNANRRGEAAPKTETASQKGLLHYEDTHFPTESPADERKVDVDVPSETNFNDQDCPTSHNRDKAGFEESDLSQEIFDQLPLVLREACGLFVDGTERGVFLVSALGVLSGIMPNYEAMYRGATIKPNLFVYVVGPYGEGKGAMAYARRLAAPIHEDLQKEYRSKKKEYEDDMRKYNKALKAFQGSSDAAAILPQSPVPPPHFKLFIPANNSKTGMFQLLSDNRGKGIIFETEGDTLADSLQQDYGNFSDGLRKAFHHEPISYFRRSHSEDVEIASPQLSVVLSSTQDQLRRLIPSAENGLFSRFLFYQVKANPEFDNVFDPLRARYAPYFDSLGERMQELHQKLQERNRPLVFELQANQERSFVEVFNELKSELIEHVSADLGGSVNRLGLICFRIAMIFSVLRIYEKGDLPGKVVCTDLDFENALSLIKSLQSHMLRVYWKMPKPKQSAMNTTEEKAGARLEQIRQCRDLYEQQLRDGKSPNYRAIALKVLGSENKRSSVYRWIHG